MALRTDGGLQTGRDLLVAALLGAEEFAFGTAMLVALGCDMARQCHLDTCPTGIATQREDLRAKFTGTPEQVERFAQALAEDLRRELAAVGARSVGEVVGEGRRLLAPARSAARRSISRRRRRAAWGGHRAARRADPAVAGRDVRRQPRRRSRPISSPRSAARRVLGRWARALRPPIGRSARRCRGALERGQLRGPIRLELRGAAGQSFGAFAGPGVELRLVGQANDYVGKGLSGGRSSSPRSPISRADAPRAGDRRQHRACTARPAGGSTSSAGPGCGSPSGTPAPRPSSRASARTAAST